MSQIFSYVKSSLLCVVALTCFAFADDWPQWRGPHRDDISRETGLLQDWPEGGPKRLWLSNECGLGYSGFAIVEGRLYTMGQENDQEFVLCLNAESGEPIWKTNVGGAYQNNWGDGPRSTPTVDHGEVFMLTADGEVACLDAEKGDKKWSVSLLDFGGTVPNWGYAESVLVDGERVVCTPGGAQGTMLALNRKNGEKIWQSSGITNGAHYSSIVSAEIGMKPQYVQLTPEDVFGVDTTDGTVLWKSHWGGTVAVIPTPIVRDDKVYVTSGYTAGCTQLAFEDGQPKQVYRNMVMKNHHGGVILIGDYLYGFSDGAGWLCQDWKTGERVWNERNALGKGAIGYADGRIYCVDESSGTVVLAEATADGWKEHGRFTLSPQTTRRKPAGRIWVHPTIANGRLYLRDQEFIYCYDISK